MNFITKCALGMILLVGIQNANAQAEKLMTIDEQVINAENIEPIAFEKIKYWYYRHPFTEVRYKQKNTKNDYKIFFATAQDDQFHCRFTHVQNETDKQNRALTYVDGNDMAEADKQVCYRLRKTMQEFKHNNPVLHDSSLRYSSHPAFGGKYEFNHSIEMEDMLTGVWVNNYFYGPYSSKEFEKFVKEVGALNDQRRIVTVSFCGLLTGAFFLLGYIKN